MEWRGIYEFDGEFLRSVIGGCAGYRMILSSIGQTRSRAEHGARGHKLSREVEAGRELSVVLAPRDRFTGFLWASDGLGDSSHKLPLGLPGARQRRTVYVEVRGGRDDRRGASVCAPRAGNRPESSHRRTCRGGKSGLQRARWWVTPTVRSCFTRFRIGKVPQKRNRLGRGACASAAVRVKR